MWSLFFFFLSKFILIAVLVPLIMLLFSQVTQAQNLEIILYITTLRVLFCFK